MNACRPRSPEAVAEAVALVDPATNPELQPHDGLTFCNVAVAKLTALLDAAIPAVLANDQVLWLRAGNGHWTKATPGEAVAAAALGQPVVVGWLNPGLRKGDDGEVVLDEWGKPLHHHGHIALVRATPAGESGVWVAQAGASNFNLGKLIRGFGHLAPLEWFSHA